jgi:nucleoside-diphosphate-sugar epimerase
MTWRFQDDLDAIFAALAADWLRLKGARLFITGGTGFIGRWLLESLRDADMRLGLGMEAVILTRDPAAFAARVPHLAAHPAFTFVPGDILDFAMPDGDFGHVIHGATYASADLNARDPRLMFDTIVTGTRNALDLAVARSAGRVLYLSSGAVYGAQPSDLAHVGEDWRGAPDCADPKSAYGEGKRAAEMLCGITG